MPAVSPRLYEMLAEPPGTGPPAYRAEGTASAAHVTKTDLR